MEYIEQVRAWMNDHGEEFVSDLEKLVAIRSVQADAIEGMPFGEECAKALKAGEEMAAGYGFRTKNYDNYVSVADFGPEERAVDILAHLDIVGEGVGWDTDPYTVARDGDMLYGRGVADDKGPMLTALYGMRCVKELGLPISKGVRLIMGSNEETGSKDIKYYYNIEKPAPGTFTPDCDFPIYNTEKGTYKPVFTMQWDKSEALPRVARFDGGFRINVLPSDADADLLGVDAKEAEAVLAPVTEKTGVKFFVTPIEGGVKILAHGVQAHASLPHLGNNGLTALIEALCRFDLADCGSTKALRGLNEAFPHGDSCGEAMGANLEDEISGPITVVFSLMSLNEEGMRGQFDGRVPLCANEENCKAVVEKFLSDRGFTVSGRMRQGHHTPAEGEFVSTLLKCYESVTGRKGECLAMGGGTYVHDIPGGVAFGPGVPGFDNHEHGANERSMLSGLLQAACVYACAIAELCK